MLRFRTPLASLLVAAIAATAQQDVFVTSRLFVATSLGAYESYDWGEEWHPIGSGLSGTIQTFACFGPRAFAGGKEGLFASLDYGRTWTMSESWKGGEVTSLVAASYFEIEPVLFVGTAEGLYCSRDGGGRWEQVGGGLVRGRVHALAWPGPSLFVATSEGLFRSDDSGRGFSRRGRGLPSAPVLSLALSRYFGQDPVVFAGSAGGGLARSRDAGESFASLSGPAGTLYSLYWWGGSLLAGTDRGFFISHDAGESWTSAGPAATRIYAILVPAPDSPSGSDLLLGTERGVFKSSDGALTWRHPTKGLGEPEVHGFGSFPVPAEDDVRRRKR